MEEEWLDVASIGFDECLMHGRVTDGKDEWGCIKERVVKQWLTLEQIKMLNDLRMKHRQQEPRLLKAFVADGETA